MSDHPATPEVNHEANDEVNHEVNHEVNDEKNEAHVDVKRAAKLEQLAAARISAKNKKRQRDEDMVEMKSKLDSLLASTKPVPLVAESETTEPAVTVKRQRVTKEPEEEQSVHLPTKQDDQDHWSTSLIRTSAVLSLGAASWWMQNRYGTNKKPQSAIQPMTEKKSQKAPPSVLSHHVKARNSMIGRSGFVS